MIGKVIASTLAIAGAAFAASGDICGAGSLQTGLVVKECKSVSACTDLDTMGSGDGSGDGSDCDNVMAYTIGGSCYYTGTTAAACCTAKDGSPENAFGSTSATCGGLATILDTAASLPSAWIDTVCQTTYQGESIGSHLNKIVGGFKCCGASGSSVCGSDGLGDAAPTDAPPQVVPDSAVSAFVSVAVLALASALAIFL